MKRRCLFFIFFMSLCLSVFAQEKPVAVKIADYDEKTETAAAFVEKTNFFLKKLSESPKTTSGFIAIPTEEFPAYESLYRQAENILSGNPVVKDRVEILKPPPVGFRPTKLPEKTEFWLIPLNAEKPYPFEILCGLSFICPTITIESSEVVSDKKRPLTFTANLSGGTPGGRITYNWQTSDGEITSGQASPVITIDFSKAESEEVTVILEVGGLAAAPCPIVEQKVKIVKPK